MFADTLTNCAFVVAIVVLATSCGENSEKPNADGAMKRKGDKTVEQPSCAVRAASNAERSSCRDYISDFQYMVSTNRFVGKDAGRDIRQRRFRVPLRPFADIRHGRADKRRYRSEVRYKPIGRCVMAP